MDIRTRVRETGYVVEPGRLRGRLARTLKAAFAEGLLSEQTLSHRLGMLFGPRLIEPSGVVGDLALSARRPSLGLAPVTSAAAAARRGLARIVGHGRTERAPLVLALDWSGAREELVIGRAGACDIALGDATVSRRHARLIFRDGGWIVQDLASTNGTRVNGLLVGRCRLQPGDRLGLGLQLVDVD
jgi:hypothetical protein